jgi:hypothetical protein
MTPALKIAKSQLPPGFDVMVAAHAHEMKNWRAHMARVADDEKNGVTGIDRHVSYPQPEAHPMVAAAVNENDEPDYEIVDDGPTPAQIFEAKKAALLNAVSQAEFAAIEAVVPMGKRRMFAYRETAILAADQQLAAALAPAPPGLLQSLATKIGLVDQEPVDIVSDVAAQRAPEDTQFLAEQEERRQKIAAIELAAAQAHHDIEDLTPETIDAWQMPDLGN